MTTERDWLLLTIFSNRSTLVRQCCRGCTLSDLRNFAFAQRRARLRIQSCDVDANTLMANTRASLRSLLQPVLQRLYPTALRMGRLRWFLRLVRELLPTRLPVMHTALVLCVPLARVRHGRFDG